MLAKTLYNKYYIFFYMDFFVSVSGMVIPVEKLTQNWILFGNQVTYFQYILTSLLLFYWFAMK